MTTEITRPARIARPLMSEGGAARCPRCEARLLYDGAELVCITCGYEYSADLEELRRVADERTAAEAQTTAHAEPRRPDGGHADRGRGERGSERAERRRRARARR